MRENFLQRNWRAAMGWQYLLVCLADFFLFPICAWIFAYITKTPYVAWAPLTVTGAGTYHIAMGAIVSVTSYSKSKEKIANGGEVI